MTKHRRPRHSIPASDLQRGATYTATVTASAAGVGPMAAPYEWSFTTVQNDSVPGVCPCSLFNDDDSPAVLSANDPGNVELGVAFSADTDGQITGVRFYKGPGNTGAHTVSLWSTSGTQLATAPVGNESTTGWQTANFAAPVSVTAGATYIASYRAPVGRYSYTVDGLRNPVDKSPLHTSNNCQPLHLRCGCSDQRIVSELFRRPGVHCVGGFRASGVSGQPGRPVDIGFGLDVGDVTFDKSIQPGSASIALMDADGTPVSGSMATLPMGPTGELHADSCRLAQGTTYTVTVTGAKNLGGTPMAAPYVFTFTTSGQAVCPCSLLA